MQEYHELRQLPELGYYGMWAAAMASTLWIVWETKSSSGDEIANVNFLYDDIVHVLQNTIDSRKVPPQFDALRRKT